MASISLGGWRAMKISVSTLRKAGDKRLSAASNKTRASLRRTAAGCSEMKYQRQNKDGAGSRIAGRASWRHQRRRWHGSSARRWRRRMEGRKYGSVIKISINNRKRIEESVMKSGGGRASMAAASAWASAGGFRLSRAVAARISGVA